MGGVRPVTVLSDLKDELTALLIDAGLDAKDHIPSRLNPPVVVLAAGNPYVQEVFDKKTFNHDYKVNMTLTLVAGSATNDVVTTALDEAIETTLVALQGAWEAEVGRPYQLETNGALYLATDVDITTSITIA